MFDLTFNGHHASEFGIMVGGNGSYSGAERDYTVVDVIGRNGSLIYDNGRYKNCDVVYNGVIKDNFEINVDLIKSWLYSSIGYQRLEDDYHIGEYRLAQFKSLEISTWRANKGADIVITFECKPQRFLTIGEREISFSSNGTITNPTAFESKPMITLIGNGASGTITINGTTITVNSWISQGDNVLPIILDCDLCEAYYSTYNENNKISGNFPVIGSGNNSVSFTGGITQVKITPRWWHI